MDLASLIDSAAVGSTVTITPKKIGVSLPEFQATVNEVRRLQGGGIVRAKEHTESDSGNDYVDLIMVEKLRNL